MASAIPSDRCEIKEEWKALPGYEGYYEISSLGRVKRISPHPRSTVSRGGILSLVPNSKGYLIVSLHRPKVPQLTISVHRLVASVFLGKCPEGHEVNHINGDKADNRPQNLEYVTRQQNMRHAREVLGRVMGSRGEKAYNARASTAEVQEARMLLAAGVPKKVIAAKYAHSLQWAYRIAKGQARVHG